MIRDFISSAPNRFVLVNRPPASWLGITVNMTPGCDGQESTCASTWNNRPKFGGVGIGSPAFNPQLEDPLGSTQ